LIKIRLSEVQNLKYENEIMRQSNAKADAEIMDINRHGEYEFQKSQVANELREVKKDWRNTYYTKIDKQKSLITKHSAVADHMKKWRKMYDLISNYRSLTEKQRQELRMDEEDPIIAHERLDQMKQQVKEANKRMHAGEIQYEGKFEYKAYA
jgi:hypothetical protein